MNDQPLTLTLITSAISMLVFSAVAWVLAIRLLVLARQALGLAKPIVVNRLLLWGAACSVSVVVSLINLSVIMRGLNIVGHAPALAASSLLGALASFLLIFAFLPPSSYVRFIDERAARAIVS